MDIQYLYEFTIVANAGSFSAAAEQLYISQSSLTKHIQALEKELDNKLFIRSRNGLKFTEAGRILLPYAISITRDYKQAVAKLTGPNSTDRAQISVLFVPHFFMCFGNMLYLLKKKYPHMQILEHESMGADSVTAFIEKDCQIVFGYESELDADFFEIAPLFEDNAVVLLPKDHALSSSDGISLVEVNNFEINVLQTMQGLNKQLYQYINEIGLPGDALSERIRLGVIIGRVSGGAGVGILMKEPISNINNNQIGIVNLLPKIVNKICIARPKDAIPDNVSQYFWDYFVSRW